MGTFTANEIAYKARRLRQLAVESDEAASLYTRMAAAIARLDGNVGIGDQEVDRLLDLAREMRDDAADRRERAARLEAQR